jgi:hypothetical protein
MRPHGYARYRLDGCRCNICGWARAQYDYARNDAILDGNWQPFSIIGPTQRHIASLNQLGYGDRSIAILAGINRKIVRDIRRGIRHDPSRGNPPLTLIRTQTADAILTIPLDPAGLPDKTLVDATPTWQLIDDLIARGWTKTRIAQEAGLGRAIQLKRTQVTVRNAHRIEAVHARATRKQGLDLDEVEHLAGTDTAANIATRLGYKQLDNLETALRRAGRPDLITRLRGRPNP